MSELETIKSGKWKKIFWPLLIEKRNGKIKKNFFSWDFDEYPLLLRDFLAISAPILDPEPGIRLTVEMKKL